MPAFEAFSQQDQHTDYMPVNGNAPEEEVATEVNPQDLHHVAALDTTLEAWSSSFGVASKLGETAAGEYAARRAYAQGTEAVYDDNGLRIASRLESWRDALNPSVAIVRVTENTLGIHPRTWLRRYMSVAREEPVKFGWTVAEMVVPSDDSRSTGDKHEPLLEELGIDSRQKASRQEDGDDVASYDRDAIIERVVVTDGSKNGLMLVRGTRAELDKGGALTRIALVAAAGNDKTAETLHAYAERNDFSKATVDVITAEKLRKGTLDLHDPEAMGHAVVSGMKRLMGIILDQSLTLKK